MYRKSDHARRSQKEERPRNTSRLTTPRERPPWARRGVGAPAGAQAAIYTLGSLPGKLVTLRVTQNHHACPHVYAWITSPAQPPPRRDDPPRAATLGPTGHVGAPASAHATIHTLGSLPGELVTLRVTQNHHACSPVYAWVISPAQLPPRWDSLPPPPRECPGSNIHPRKPP